MLENPLEKVDFAVEANSYEKLTIWQTFHEKAKSWESISRGSMRTIGEIDKRPVCVCLFWDVINGKKVLFYEATSQVVDHEMVAKWICENALDYGNGRRIIKTDAMNFHLIWHEIQ